MTDQELLADYCRSRSEKAFAELVRRHVDWVYCYARRQVRDAHLAQDLTQATFLVLSQKAAQVRRATPLSAWLFSVLRYAVSNVLRAQRRRKGHEREAALMAASTSPSLTETQWQEIASQLDELVARLGEQDRRAVLLRFYQQKTFAEVAQATGVSEESARKRVDRAVQKLRLKLKDQRLAIGATALAAGLFASTATAAPAALASSLAAASGAAAHTVSGLAGSIAKGVITMMTLTKVKVAVVVGLICLPLTATPLIRLPLVHAQSPQALADRTARWVKNAPSDEVKFPVVSARLTVADVEASLEFYHKLGFVLASYRNPVSGSKLTEAHMAAGVARISLFEGAVTDADRQVSKRIRLTFYVEGGPEGLEEFRQTVISRGVKAGEFFEESNLRLFSVEDPDGYTIAFITNVT